MIDAPPRPATPTERKIAEMLVENTGAALMDSGGAYGRAWQHTRAKYGLDGGLPNSAWDGFPKRTVEPGQDEIELVALAMRDEPLGGFDRYGSYSLDTFHFLVEALDYDPELDAKFQRWTRVTNFGKDRWDKDWGLTLMERFAEQLQASGIYGDGSFVTENSYNGECALDRTIQFTLMTINEDGFLPTGSYVLLQIHGGADVRGGYTDPVLFSESGMSEYAILDYARVYLRCDGNPALLTSGQLGLDGRELTQYDLEHAWDSENAGYTWNLDGMYGMGQTVASASDYEIEKGALAIILDEDTGVARCPIEGCGAVLR